MKDFDRKFGRDLLAQVPAAPGVYRYFDAEGKIIYVGKAKNLRRRLGQYRVVSRRKRHGKRRRIVREAARVEWAVCGSHLEACLQEVAEIQANRPRWNVAGAYWFLYPFIGIRTEGVPTEASGRGVPGRGRGGLRLWLCYTTQPEPFAGYRFHGAYRSRGLTREAFFALTKLLGYVGEPVGAGNATTVKYAYAYGIDGLDAGRVAELERFLRGQGEGFLRGLVLGLLEYAPARQARSAVQEKLEALEAFYREEAQKLAAACEATGRVGWPVRQEERDGLFVRARERGAGK